MSPDLQLAFELGVDRVSILCDDHSIVTQLKDELCAWLTNSIAFPGFKIETPTPDNRMWVLLGSDGTILGRSVERDLVVRALKRHLGSIAATPTEGPYLRTSLRAISGPASAVILDKALLQKQPFAERQYQRYGLAVLDAPFVDLVVDTPSQLHGLSVPDAFAIEAEPGHSPVPAGNLPVQSLLWPATEDASQPTHAQVTHALASVSMNGTHRQRLDRASTIARDLPIRFVSIHDRNSALTAARELLAR